MPRVAVFSIGGIEVTGFEPIIGPLIAWLLRYVKLRPIRRWVKAYAAWAAPDTHFSILIADLEGDDERKAQTRHIERALDGTQGIRPLRAGRVLVKS